MQQTVFEVNASNVEPLVRQPNTKHKSRTRCIASKTPREQESGIAAIWNTLAGNKKNTTQNRKSSNVAGNAMPIAERLIRSLLNTTSDGATNGIKRTGTVFQKNVGCSAQLGAWPTATGANTAPIEPF